jgi:hypothetical protein
MSIKVSPFSFKKFSPAGSARQFPRKAFKNGIINALPRIAGLFIVSCCAGYAFSQTVDITGTVQDSSSAKGIAGASVIIKGLALSTLTNANGGYSFAGSAARFNDSRGQLYNDAPVFKNNVLFFGVGSNDERVRIDIFDLAGRLIAKVLDDKLCAGQYRINPFTSPRAELVYVVRLTIGPRVTMLRIPLAVRGRAASANARLATGNGLEKTAGVIDTLEVSAAGYAVVRRAVESYTGVQDFFLLKSGGHRGALSFENGSYQSCVIPLVITVVDSDLVAETLPIKVQSSSDQSGITVLLKKVAGLSGTYSDSVFFSVATSDSARRLIRVRDGDTVAALYADAAPLALYVETTVWTGLPGDVQPKGSPISGVIHGLGMTLWDSDITDSVVTISVWSKKDTVGIHASLARVALSSGDYIGYIGLTLRQSRGDSVLAVGPGSDTIFMKYHDVTPEADIMGTGCIWQPMLANMFLDSAQYHGAASRMTINLTDDDVEDGTVVVRIKSATDPAGITDTLKAAGGINRYFDGSVGFAVGASAPGRIAVADGDSVWVSYQEETPARLVTQSAVWSTQ